MARRHLMEPDPDRNVDYVQTLWLVAAVLAIVFVIALFTHP